MKRAEVIAGASAYIMASAEDEDVYPLTQNALSKARARLALEERRAMDRLNGATERSFGEDAWLAKLIVEHAYDREAAALATLTRLATDQATTQYVREQAASLRSEGGGAVRRLDAHRDLLEKNRGWKFDPAVEEQTRAAGLVPVRTKRALGPINFFRPEYGRDWMIQETGDPDFASKVRLAKRGHYYLYETLSFTDGKRSLGDIRIAVAVEYGPAPLDEIEEYFRLLEKVGVVELR